MALKIKEGSTISPYGEQAKTFTSADVLPQAVLEHLQTRFPDDIVDDEADKKESCCKTKIVNSKIQYQWH